MAFPSNACIIQEAIGAKPAAAFDLQAACSGFVYALVTAAQYVLAGNMRYALVVAAEINSTIVDPMDQKVTPLFGDGAAGMVVGRPGSPGLRLGALLPGLGVRRLLRVPAHRRQSATDVRPQRRQPEPHHARAVKNS